MSSNGFMVGKEGCGNDRSRSYSESGLFPDGTLINCILD